LILKQDQFFKILGKFAFFRKQEQKAVLKRAKDVWAKVAAYFAVIFSTKGEQNLPFVRSAENVKTKGLELLQLYVKRAGEGNVTPYIHICTHHIHSMMVLFFLFFFFFFFFISKLYLQDYGIDWIRTGAFALEAKHPALNLFAEPKTNYGQANFARMALEVDFLQQQSPPAPASRSRKRAKTRAATEEDQSSEPNPKSFSQRIMKQLF
jgi:hypothetical protein